MTISIVSLTSSDRQRLLDVDRAAFFFDPTAYPVDVVTSHFDWARTFATKDGKIVARIRKNMYGPVLDALAL